MICLLNLFNLICFLFLEILIYAKKQEVSLLLPCLQRFVGINHANLGYLSRC